MSEQVGSVTRKKSSDFQGGIRFQSSFTKNFHKIAIICLDDSLKYGIMAIKTNESFTPFSNSVTFRKPRGTDLVTASELITGFCRSKSIVIFLDFHSTKQGLPLVDSWSRDLD